MSPLCYRVLTTLPSVSRFQYTLEMNEAKGPKHIQTLKNNEEITVTVVF